MRQILAQVYTVIRIFDSLVLYKLYQRFVDKVQKKPHWLAEQCGWGQTVCAILRPFLVATPITGMEWFTLGMGLLCGAVLILVARVPAILAGSTGPGWRLLWVWMLSVSIMGLFLRTSAERPELAVRIVSDIFITSFYYFAACRPPKPRKKTEKAKRSLLVPNGTA